MSTEVTALERESQTLTTTVDTLVIADPESYARAGEGLRTVALYIKRVGEVLDPICEAAFHSHKVAVAQRDTLLRPAQAAKRVLGDRMAAWDAEQARLRREAEAAAQRERERLERDAREQAEAEQRRLTAAAEDRRLAEATEMEARGDGAGAARLLEAPMAIPVVTPAPVFAPAPAPPAAPKVEGVSYREDFDFVIDDPLLIPREYLKPDDVKIRGVVRALKAAAYIPGIRVVSKRIATVRSA